MRNRVVIRNLRRLSVLAVSALVAASVLAPPALSAQTDAGHSKAAVVASLVRFIEWPAGSFRTPHTPLDICVLGVDPFGTHLDDAFRTQRVADRPVAVRRVHDVDARCHVLWVSTSEGARLASMVEQLQAAPVLTLSEAPGFCRAGGMIRLVPDGERIRFRLNVAAMTAARLRASARLREIGSTDMDGDGGQR